MTEDNDMTSVSDGWHWAKVTEADDWEPMYVEGNRALRVVWQDVLDPDESHALEWNNLGDIHELGKSFKEYEQEHIELQDKVAAFDGHYTIIDDNPTLLERTTFDIIEQATRSDKNLWGRQLRVMGILGSFEKEIRVDERHAVSSEILHLQEEVASIQKLADRRLRERDAERAQIDALRAALDLKMGEGLSLEEIIAHVKALGITGDHIKATALQIADAVEQERQRALAEQAPRGGPFDNYGCWEIQDDDGNHMSWMWGAIGTPSEEDIREGDEDPLTLDEMTEAIATHRAAVAASCFPEMAARIVELQKQNEALLPTQTDISDEDIDTMPDGPDKRSARERSIRRWLDVQLPSLRDVARSLGYTIAIHGSLARDVDLVAIPWIEAAATPEVLACTIRDAIAGQFSKRQDGSIDLNHRPHGRESWAIVTPSLWGSYIDLSVMSTSQVAILDESERAERAERERDDARRGWAVASAIWAEGSNYISARAELAAATELFGADEALRLFPIPASTEEPTDV